MENRVVPTVTPAYFEHALCSDVPLGTMYPEEGDKFSEAIAKSVCDGCPVEPECLDWAMQTREGIGVWGGKTASERQHYRRKIARNANAVIHLASE